MRGARQIAIGGYPWCLRELGFRPVRRCPLVSSIRRRCFGWAAALGLALICGASPANPEERGYFRIGAAGTGGSFFEIGGVIAGAISKPPGTPPCDRGGSCGVPGLVAVAQATQGSVDNLRLIAAGRIESGIAQSDIVSWVFDGNGPIAGDGPLKQLRAIASLFPEQLQIVVRADGPIRTLQRSEGPADFVGRDRIREPWSTLRVVLAAAGLGEKDVLSEYQRPSTAAANLRNGTLDGFFLIGGVPVPAIRELASTTPIRLVPIDDEVLSRMQQTYSLYRRAVIAGDTYPGIEGDTPSIGFRAIWVVAGDASEDLIYAITKALWNDATRRLLDASGPIGQQVVLEDALDGLSLPLHPGAKRFYREAGLPVEDEPARTQAN